MGVVRDCRLETVGVFSSHLLITSSPFLLCQLTSLHFSDGPSEGRRSPRIYRDDELRPPEKRGERPALGPGDLRQATPPAQQYSPRLGRNPSPPRGICNLFMTTRSGLSPQDGSASVPGVLRFVGALDGLPSAAGRRNRSRLPGAKAETSRRTPQPSTTTSQRRTFQPPIGTGRVEISAVNSPWRSEPYRGWKVPGGA